LTYAGEAVGEIAQYASPPPKEVKGGQINRLILPPAYENGASSCPDVRSPGKPEQKHGPEEGDGLTGVDLQAQSPKQPGEQEHVGYECPTVNCGRACSGFDVIRCRLRRHWFNRIDICVSL